GLLVGDKGAVPGPRTIDRRLGERLPEHLVAAENGEVDAAVAREFDVLALLARPVLVVPDRQEGARANGAAQPHRGIAAEAGGVDAPPLLHVLPACVGPARPPLLSV